MAQPVVSVVLPTRNRAHLVGRAIASVLLQTWRELELIVVDDASTDATREVLSAQTDPRLRIIHREVNKGAAAARNAGIAAARGEFVAFLDDDDYWLAQKLEKQLAAMRSAPDTTGFCLTGFVRLEPTMSRYIGGEAYIRRLDHRNGMDPSGPTWSMIATPGWLVRRSMLDKVGGFDERIRSWDDWELSLRLWRECGRIVVDEALWVQDWEQGSGLVKAERARASDLRIFLDKFPGLWDHDRRLLAYHWYLVGRGESLYDPAPAGRDALWNSLRLWPLRPAAWAALALSHLGQPATQKVTRLARRLKGALSA